MQRTPLHQILPTKRRMENLKKNLTTRNLVDLFKEGDIEQQLQDTNKRNNANPSYQHEGKSSYDSLRHKEPSEHQSKLYESLKGQMSKKLLYKSRQTTVPFLSRLDNHYCEEEEAGNYGPKFTEAYGASHINNVIPRKEKDSGGFTLPFFINTTLLDNALYRTVKYPKGIAENVLVGIGKFTFLVDFIILDMPEDIKVPLILGRPFLSTARAKIDVYKRKITLRVGEERIIFSKVSNSAENNVVGALINVPIFVGTFSVVSDFAVLEDMDVYHDDGMGDVSEKEEMNGISHAYQKLKGFYKGVLNLGPDYIRNAKTKEWLTRGHVSAHEME
ncbi:hypothetical protein Tco_1283491 [Tanacetum coccineum]